MKRLAGLFLVAILSLPARAGVPDPKGLWEFDGPDHNAATAGAPLELVGSIKEVPGIAAGDGAIQIGEGSYYRCTLGLAPNGGGAKVNEWTLLIDFSYPPGSRSDPPNGYNDLFQTNPTNVDDADWTINSAGGIGIGAVGYTSAHGYTTRGDTWYRMVVVVDNGTRHDIYVDGVEIFQGTQQGIDGRFSLADVLLLFCAGNNQDRDDAPINVSTVAVWDVPLSADDVFAMGRAGVGFYVAKGASGPEPANGARDVLLDADLAWTPGKYAATHRVYLSSSRDEVVAAAPAALVAERLDLDVNNLDIDGLDYGQTYYWRVDEVNGAPDDTVFEGPVWSFTTESYAYPITGLTVAASSEQPASPAVRTIDGSGLDHLDQHSITMEQMWMSSGGLPAWIQYTFDKEYTLHELWVWNANTTLEGYMGFGAKDVTIECSRDGQTWTRVENVAPFARGTGLATYTANTTIELGGVRARHVRLTVTTTWGAAGIASLSEVRFFYIPVQAFAPQPAVGATGVGVEAALDWRSGRLATSHQVYLGVDADAVAAGAVPVETVAGHGYPPADLTFATTYFWKVDEVGDAGVYPGNVWSFTTQEFTAIDDMERYTDDEGSRIYQTWIDGMTTKLNGSTVGYMQAPFAERKLVHGGAQSMPLAYDNTAAPYYSEAERIFDAPQDWTVHGANTVSLYFQGVTPAFQQTAAGHILMNGIGADIWNAADQFRFAHKTLTGNGAMIARVNSVYQSDVWAKAGVMIRQNTSAGSVHAFMCLAPGGSSAGNGASFQRRPVANAVSTNSNSPTLITAPYWVKIERVGDSFSGSISPDGVTWTALGTAVSIPMTGPVLIGLAVCSHNTAILTGADFSDLATTGNVTGDWQLAEIGATQQEGNAPAPIYIAVRDSAGKIATIVNPDAAATGRMGWQPWRIPLSDLTSTGLKTTAIQSVTIGVGNRAGPSAGGAGTIYIDDIGFGVPLR